MLPPPLQSSLPAGWLASTGRELNPLDHFKRFQITLSSPFSGFILAQEKFHYLPPWRHGWAPRNLSRSPTNAKLDVRNARPPTAPTRPLDRRTSAGPTGSSAVKVHQVCWYLEGARGRNWPKPVAKAEGRGDAHQRHQSKSRIFDSISHEEPSSRQDGFGS